MEICLLRVWGYVGWLVDMFVDGGVGGICENIEVIGMKSFWSVLFIEGCWLLLIVVI